MPQTGGFSPLPRESCSPESEACFFLFSELIRLFKFDCASQRGNSHVALLHGNYQPRTLDLARDIMQLHVYLVPRGRNHLAGNYSLLPDPAPHVQAAMASLAHKKKTNLAIRGILHASTCATVRNLHRAFC